MHYKIIQEPKKIVSINSQIFTHWGEQYLKGEVRWLTAHWSTRGRMWSVAL